MSPKPHTPASAPTAAPDITEQAWQPDFDMLVGRRLRLRDVVHVGETWERVRIPNLPKEPETVAAIRHLVTTILDPVDELFGPIRLTYGFASPELTRHIPGRIDPSRDQHAGHERRPNGTFICDRLGQAADFHVDGLDMGRVALWVARNLPFDRIYFYGSDRPVHVSVGPQNSRSIVTMLVGLAGRRVPANRSLGWLESRFG